MYINTLKHNFEFQLLPYQFFLLSFWGMWCPENWTNKEKNIQKLFFSCVIFLDIIICLEMLIYFLTSLSTDYFKLINLFFVTANITGVYKAIKISHNRENLRCFILAYFDYQWLKSYKPGEDEIYEKTDSKIRHITITYSASMIGIVLLRAMSPLAESGLVISLPVDAWYPYSVENPYWFWITYIHQVILGSSAVCAHVAVDTLFVGLLLKMSCQIDVLKHRLRNLTKSYDKFKINYSKAVQKKVVLQCIHHHQRIYRFGDDLNNQFQVILIILVLSSLPNICINVYALSTYKDTINIDYLSTLFCTTSALIQFFITCWFGNEVSLNSVEVKNAVYEMDWNTLDVSVQRLLVMVMARSSKPILFTVGYVIPMNLNSFIKIIKASYTTFNLIQQTSN